TGALIAIQYDIRITVGYSGSRLDVCILSFVGRSGAETNEWQRGSRSVISAPVARSRSAGACNYLLGEHFVLLFPSFHISSISKMSFYL
ncbi:hypothetical protein, partial [Sulfurovum sp.]|uniref:hypothetical protein n=1 Tax=Sulfurovum sp. TaxID=1969726 RepID=UPI0025E7899F